MKGDRKDSSLPSVTMTGSDPGGGVPVDRTVTSTGRPDREAVATPSPPPGTELVTVPSDFYRVEAEVGRGGVGVVLRAHDRRLGRQVALKQLQQVEPRSRMRFEREMRITAKLQHPGVVPIHEAGVLESGAPFYSMKLIEGRSLKELIAERKTLDERLELLPTIVAVVETIAYAHSQGVIHRDIKPSNVIVGAYGETVVIDWGLAKDLAVVDAAAPDDSPYRSAAIDDMTVVGQVVGTPAYMPPEQARGEEVGKAADVYSLGAVLRQAITGEPPYRAPSAEEMLKRVLSAGPRPIGEVIPGVPRDLCAVVDKAMARDVAARYADAAALLVDLKGFLNGRLVSAYSYGAGERLQKWATRRRGVVLTAAAAACVLLAVVAVSMQRIIRERDAAIQSRNETSEKSNALIREQAAREIDQRNVIRAFEILRAYPRDAKDWNRILPLVNGIEMSGLPDFWSRETMVGGKGVKLAIDSSSRFIFVASGSEIDIWNLRTKRKQQPIQLGDRKGAVLKAFSVERLGESEFVVAGLSTGNLATIGIPSGTSRWYSVLRQVCHGGINDFAAYPGQPIVAIGCDDGEVVSVDLLTGTVRSLARHGSGSSNVGFISRRVVVSIAGDGLLRYSSLDEPNRDHAAKIGGTSAFMTSGSHCGRMAVGTSDGRLVIVGAEGTDSTSEEYAVAPGASIKGVGIDHSCRLAYGLSNSEKLTVVDLVLHKQIYSGVGRHVEFYAERSGLVIGTESGEVEYLEPLTGWKQVWRVSAAPIWTLAVSSDGTIVALGDIIVAFRTDRIGRTFLLEQAAPTLATMSDESAVALGGIDGGVGFFDVGQGNVTEFRDMHRGLALVRSGPERSAYSAGSEDGCVWRWDDEQPGAVLFCIPGGIRDIAVSNDSRVFVATEADTLAMYNPAHPASLVAVPVPGIRRVAVGVSGRVIASTSRDEVHLLDADLRNQRIAYPGTTMNIVSESASGELFGVTAAGHLLRFDGSDLKRSIDLAGCRKGIYRTWFATEGDRILLSCLDGSVSAWPRIDGLENIVHADEALDVDGSPDGLMVASCSKTGTLSIVDSRTEMATAMTSSIPLTNLELLKTRGIVVVSTKQQKLLATWSSENQSVAYPIDGSGIYAWLHKEEEF